jgi:hypothetical protein
MKQVEVFRWWIFGYTGKRHLTGAFLSRAEAVQLFPGATPHLATRAIRWTPDPVALPDPLGILVKCEVAGAKARYAGVGRDANPFAERPAAETIRLLAPQARQELAQAWWRGWDGVSTGARRPNLS